MKKMIHACCCLGMAAGMCVSGLAASAQEQPLFPALQNSQETPPQDASQAPLAQSFPGSTQSAQQDSAVDPSLTTHEAAVQCALARIVEDAGERHLSVGDTYTTTYRAGICVGNIQTYILNAQAAHPDCFPKMGLEEGIKTFINWVEAHPEQGATLYTVGMNAAFMDAVPCLKK